MFRLALHCNQEGRATVIICKILGGLGNQMFQYAAGRALSLEKHQMLRLHIADFNKHDIHQGFELQRVFNLSVNRADGEALRRVLGWQSYPLLRRALSRPGLTHFRRRNFIVEPHFHFWPAVTDVPAECYLAGYWQSQKYFDRVIPDIRSDFSFKSPISGRNVEIANEIGNSNAVSIHVRRGDYVMNARTNATHGVCSLDYYRTAMQHVAHCIETPRFFVFSDDIEWVRENLPFDFPCQYVDHNHGLESYNDMRLMSLCRHHIIANSSFSWWAAWLNPRTDKIVTAPGKWFANNNDVRDLLPKEWVAL